MLPMVSSQIAATRHTSSLGASTRLSRRRLM
nr:MAG TPA: hypothetical protein [Caudoviricetes sp.]